ncbi:DNA primase [Pseudomonas phage WP1]
MMANQGPDELDLTQIEDAGMDPLMTAASKAADDAIARNETHRAQKAARYAEAHAEPGLRKRARLLMLDQAFDLPVSRVVKGPFDDFITKYSSTSDSNYLAVYDTCSARVMEPSRIRTSMSFAAGWWTIAAWRSTTRPSIRLT